MNAQTFRHAPHSREQWLLTASPARRICRAKAPFHLVDMDRIAGRLLALSALGVALCAAVPARADLLETSPDLQVWSPAAPGLVEDRSTAKEGASLCPSRRWEC